MTDTSSELNNELMNDYFDQYKEFSYDKNNTMDSKQNPTNIFLDAYDYIEWFKTKMKRQLIYHSRYQKVMTKKQKKMDSIPNSLQQFNKIIIITEMIIANNIIIKSYFSKS